MDYTKIRKGSLKVFIGFLVLTALIAILSVLSGDIGELQVKILATTFTISAASILSMSCAAFIEKRKLTELGLSGIFLSVAGATLLIVGLWSEMNADEYWKSTVTLIVFAAAFAQAFLLYLPDLDDRHTWIQPVSSLTIGILAVQIVVAVWGEIDGDIFYRLLTVVAIIAVLETLVIPILMKLRKGTGEKELLVLEKVGDELYKDAAGTIYNVTECDPE